MKHATVSITLLATAALFGCSRDETEGSPPKPVSHMTLELHAPPNHKPVVLVSNPTPAQVTEVVRGQKWQDIIFIVLKQDDSNWFEVSGAANPDDGFSARYMAAGKEFVSSKAPESMNEMIALLHS